jgi:large subunit ribosomal protein L35
MPKMKSNSGAKKRFSLTASGRVKCNRAGKSHILTKKSRKRKRNLRRRDTVDHAQEHQVKRILPFLK